MRSLLPALLTARQPVVAPLVLSPLMARLAQQAGFRALYLGGGGLGYDKCVTEANLNATEMTQLALDIRVVCDLPLILDAAGGWGDAMHLRRTVRLAEAAGFSAIEIEDQQLPKRAHHHIGIDHPVPMDVMVDKIREAVAARRSKDFLIIARTNLARESLAQAIERAAAYKAAGADVLFVLSWDAEQLREIGARLPPPLMFMTGVNGLSQLPMPLSELADCNVRLVVDPVTPQLAMHKALQASYLAISALQADPAVGAGGPQELRALQNTIDLEALLAIERRTVERGGS